MKHHFALLLVLTATVYAPFLGGGFVTDDFPHIAHLQSQSFPEVLVTPDTFGYYRPMTQASLLADLVTTSLIQLDRPDDSTIERDLSNRVVVRIRHEERVARCTDAPGFVESRRR